MNERSTSGSSSSSSSDEENGVLIPTAFPSVIVDDNNIFNMQDSDSDGLI
jgi:hypothetical protein